MTARLATPVLVAAGIAYLLLFGWAVTNVSYDVWGVFVVAPVLFVLGALIVRRMFIGDLAPLVPVLTIGILLKFAGAYARYWVGYDAYQGGIDAGRYHTYAVEKLGPIFAGESSVWGLWPSGTGTPFMEELSAVIFAVSGTSLVGGFFVFAWLAYIGTLWFVKAACVAVPGLAARRYAVLLVLAPSVVYWPASIGKEAWMFLTLGLAAYGFARILARQGLLLPVAWCALGLLGAGMVRPHMAGLFVAGAIPALIVAAFARVRSGERSRAGDTFVLAGVAVLAVVGLSVAAAATLQLLNFTDDEGAVTTTSIIEETQRRTEQAGSFFEPPSIDNPATWPYASVRTLTRPLPHEARGLAQMISAAEMTLLIGIALVSWRRLANVPRLVVRVPYVAFAVSFVFFGSLAMTSFANLGVLTRQRTILFPLLLLLLAVPTRREDLARRELEDEAAEMERLRQDVLGRGIDAVSRSAPVPAAWRAGRVAASVAVDGPGGATAPDVRTVDPWSPSRGAHVDGADGDLDGLWSGR